jgi:hypothetical protein
MAAHRARRIDEDVELRGLDHRVELFFDALQIGFFDGVHHLILNFVRHAPYFADHLPDGAQHTRQVFRPDDDQGDGSDDEDFTDVEIKHISRPYLPLKRFRSMPDDFTQAVDVKASRPFSVDRRYENTCIPRRGDLSR